MWNDDMPDTVTMTITGQWTWENFHEVEAAIAEEAKVRKGRVAIIYDLSSNTFMPPGNVVAHFQQSGELHARLDVRASAYAVRDAAYSAFVRDALDQFGAPNTRYEVTHTLEEAVAFCKSN